MSKILIFAEQRGGDLHPAVRQLLTAAREIDGGAEITVCLVGAGLTTLASELSTCGVAGVVAVDDPKLERYRPQPYSNALSAAIDKVQPNLVLLPATFMGRDLAPRVAARCNAALATDCVEAKLDGDALIVKRPAYIGKATAELKLAGDRLKVVSIRPNTFAAAVDAQDGASANIEALDLKLDASDEKLVNRELVGTTGGVKDVTEADIVVSGGRSLKSEENFKIIYDLAKVLDAAVGASRAACDAGYQPHSRQVGLTGKTVTPKLYMAFGIDGAIQHLAGMRGSKVIVAINTKKEAPIFNVATYGCVADLFIMAPLLVEEFKKVLAK
ncbi:MAG: electron transfer flavoprotein subunit alpha/FixB family protein [Planctomycetes bacterium]|nr:electron transfer flavoprotein subunit alpha/FixB family protein [Planctomycetota bacterium]